MQAVVGALRDVVVDHRVTNEEWHAALAFLTEIGRADEFVLLSDVNHLSVAVDQMTHDVDAATTPSNVLGPFWLPDAPFLDSPARIGRADEPGEPLVVTGTVRTPGGDPVPGAILDVWQTATNRLYGNQDPEQPDLNLRGRIRVAGDGGYELRTVKPVSYQIPTDGPVGRFLARLGRHAWRPAHLHVRVDAPGCVPLTTMLYFAGDPWLDDDAIGSVKDALIVEPVRDETGAWGCAFDFVLQRASD